MHVASGNLTLGAAPAPIVEGQLVSDDYLSEEEVLQRTSSEAIRTRFRLLEKFVVYSGLFTATAYLLICIMYLWVSFAVPPLCNVRLRKVFLWLGIVNAVMGCIMACYVCAAHMMLSAMSHGARADSLRMRGLDEEASTEESDYEGEARRASRCVLVPSACYFLAMNALVVCWVFGIIEATTADDDLCNGAELIFWLLFTLNVCNLYGSAKSGAASYEAPIGRMIPG